MADPVDSLIVAGNVSTIVGGLPTSTERMAGMTSSLVQGLPNATFRVAGLVVAIVVSPATGSKSQVMLGTF